MEQDQQVRDRELVEERQDRQDQDVVAWAVPLLRDQAEIVSVPVAAKKHRTQQGSRAIKCNVQNAVRP